MRPWVAFVVLSILLTCSPVAEANSLPVRWVTPGSGVILVEEGPQARVVDEDLEIDIAPSSPRTGSQVKVKARYSLRLIDKAQEQDVQIAFIHNGAKSCNVALDDVPVHIEKEGPATVEGLALEMKTYDPLTGEEYEISHGMNRSAIASFFTIHLEPGKTHSLVVEHTARSGWDEIRYVNPISHFTYYLRPAEKWAGFGNLSVTLRVPWGYRVVTSLDGKLQRESPGVLRGTLKGLPNNDLHISLMSGSGMLPGIATRGGIHFLWLLSLLAYLVAPALRVPLPAMNLAGFFFALVSTWALTRRLWLYPFEFLQAPILVIILLATAVSLWRRNRWLWPIVNRALGRRSVVK